MVDQSLSSRSMRLRSHQAWQLLSRTVVSWRDDYAPSMGAALAFYTMFSITPLVLIVIAVSGYFMGNLAARGEIVAQLADLMGPQGAQAIQDLLTSANSGPVRRSMVAGVGIVVFLIGATSVFNELQDSLNRIFRAPRSSRKGGFFALVRARLLSFGMILAIAFLMLVSLVLSAAFSGLGKWWGPMFEGWQPFAQLITFALGFALTTATFAILYKLIPQKKVMWHDIWMGACTTAMLFMVGKQVIGIYLGHSIVVSRFGKIGSLAVFLLWVYYSAQIFLFGAEFTWVYSTIRREREHLPQETVASGKETPMRSKGARAAASNPTGTR